ncbi:MAG: transcriptional regulator GlxA family with amidase domain [Polaribacter sp.]|jgi:transcriptional regulator GlxA family with amidase domain
MIDFMKKVDKGATFITSHRNGTFVLGAARLLKDKISATFLLDIDKMSGMFPNLAIKKTCYLCIS